MRPEDEQQRLMRWATLGFAALSQPRGEAPGPRDATLPKHGTRKAKLSRRVASKAAGRARRVNR